MSPLRRRAAQAAGDDAYLRAVTGPVEAPVEAPAEAEDLDVPLDVVIAPDASTVEALVARLTRLDPGGLLVGTHRIVVTTITPAPAQIAEPVEATPAESDADRLPDPPRLASDPEPTAPDSPQPPIPVAPPTLESVALLIGELNGRPVTADQLRIGLRIAPEKSRDLRDLVNDTLFPLRAGPHGT